MSKNWDKFEAGVEKGPASATWTIGKWVIGVGLMAMLAVGIWTLVAKPFIVAGKVTDPDRIIYNYEYFYNQAEAKRAIQRKIDGARKSVTNFDEAAGPRENWTFEDKTERARLTSIADGLMYQCADVVADYNAKAKQVTRSIFKTDSTPYRLQECE